MHKSKTLALKPKEALKGLRSLRSIIHALQLALSCLYFDPKENSAAKSMNPDAF